MTNVTLIEKEIKKFLHYLRSCKSIFLCLGFVVQVVFIINGHV